MLKKYNVLNNKNNGNLKIIFISDFHNKDYKNKTNLIIEKILNVNPDIILLGGDFINFSKKMLENNEVGIKNTIKFINILCQKINYNLKDIKIYFALGNHEIRLKECKKPELEKKYLEFVRFLLNNNIQILEDGTNKLNDDYSLSTLNLFDGYYNKIFNRDKNNKIIDKRIFDKYFSDLNNECFNIAAFHKPDYAINFIDFGFDLVLSGHYHGGLVKLPFLGVLFSPDIKPFPKYGYGLYKILDMNTSNNKVSTKSKIENFGNYNTGHLDNRHIRSAHKYIVVSSGLGEHFINIRINNYPEICLINIIGNGRNKV